MELCGEFLFSVFVGVGEMPLLSDKNRVGKSGVFSQISIEIKGFSMV